MASKSYISSFFSYWQRRPGIVILGSGSILAVGYGLPVYYHSSRSKPSLNPSTFTPYTLIEKHQISSTSSIFTLRPPPSEKAAHQLRQLWGGAGPLASDGLWSVQAKQPHLQIGREYTPLPPSAILHPHIAEQSPATLEKTARGDPGADIHLLIRKEKGGEMTTYLHGLPLDATVHLRGPYTSVSLPSHVDEVLFVAGGTGIAPALQVAHILARRAGAKMHVLWANRRREECLGAPTVAQPPPVPVSSWSVGSIASAAKKAVSLSSLIGMMGTKKTSAKNSQPEETKSTAIVEDPVVKEAQDREGMPEKEEKGVVVRMLEEMKSKAAKGALTVEYFVDEEDTFIRQRHVREILARERPPKEASENTPPTGAKLIMVSGPEGFVDYWAGRKRMEDGEESQGPLGGVLAEMDLKGWRVWKL